MIGVEVSAIAIFVKRMVAAVTTNTTLKLIACTLTFVIPLRIV
jgi:hypothetical protein